LNERILRLDTYQGAARIIPLWEAVSELSGHGLYSEIAPRLRGGETVRLPNGLRYRAVAALAEGSIDRLPPAAVN
jgi:hypothetical protein